MFPSLDILFELFEVVNYFRKKIYLGQRLTVFTISTNLKLLSQIATSW